MYVEARWLPTALGVVGEVYGGSRRTVVVPTRQQPLDPSLCMTSRLIQRGHTGPPVLPQLPHQRGVLSTAGNYILPRGGLNSKMRERGEYTGRHARQTRWEA